MSLRTKKTGISFRGHRQPSSGMPGLAHLLQCLRHDLGPVVDGEHNVRDTGLGEGLDLVLDHGLVSELDQRLRESESLVIVSMRHLGRLDTGADACFAAAGPETKATTPSCA